MKARYGVREEARELWRHWLEVNDIPPKDIAFGTALVTDDSVEIDRFISDEAGHKIVHTCTCGVDSGHFARERVTFPITVPLGDWARIYLIGEVAV